MARHEVERGGRRGTPPPVNESYSPFRGETPREERGKLEKRKLQAKSQREEVFPAEM